MPTPQPNQSKDDFISMFMESEKAKTDYPDEEQRLAVANSMWEKRNKKGKELKFSAQIKEYYEDGEDFYSEGFVATTHPDRAAEDGVDGDILTKQAIENITSFINENVATINGPGATRLVSKRHDWLKEQDPYLEPAGIVVPLQDKVFAETRQLPDGHWGTYIKVLHNKSHPEYEDIVYKVKNGFYPGYSIEYGVGDFQKVSYQGKIFRLINSIADYVGQAFADARMIANPNALISSYGYKELLESKEKDEDKPLNKPFRLPSGSSKKFGVYVKDGDKIKKVTFGDPDMEIKRDDDEARSSFRARHKCDQQSDKTSAAYWSCKMWEKGFSVSDVLEKEIKEANTMDYEKLKKKKEAGEELSEEETAFLKAEEEKKKASQKEQQVKESEETPEDKSEGTTEESKEEKEVPQAKEISVKEVVEKIRESPEYKEVLDSLKVESKVMKNKDDKGENMQISIKEMIAKHQAGNSFEAQELGKELLFGSKAVKEAIDTVATLGSGTKIAARSNINVKCSGKGLKISGVQTKDTLVTGDNASTYTQDDVEFADVFAPGIIDTFNNQTNLFGFLKKEQHIGGSSYQWKMVTNKDPNSVNTFVGQNDIAVTKNFSSKENYQTPLKVARRGVSVSDFISRYSARSLGDLFQLELDLQMTEMMNDINAALFAEVADGTGNAPLGLEAVADSAGNTTLYGKTRSTANRLSPDAAGDTYTAVGGVLTEAALRTKITHLINEGSRMEDIAIVASPTTYEYLLNLLDGNRRYNTVEATFGFNRKQVASYDGFPIIRDSDCNSDAIYVIDSSNRGAVIVVGMEPKIIELAKTGAAMEAYVQMEFAFVYKQPRRIGMLDTLSAS